MTNNLVKVSKKTYRQKYTNTYQIFHIYQIKNLFTQHFINKPNFSNLYIYVPDGNNALIAFRSVESFVLVRRTTCFLLLCSCQSTALAKPPFKKVLCYCICKYV